MPQTVVNFTGAEVQAWPLPPDGVTNHIRECRVTAKRRVQHLLDQTNIVWTAVDVDRSPPGLEIVVTHDAPGDANRIRRKIKTLAVAIDPGDFRYAAPLNLDPAIVEEPGLTAQYARSWGRERDDSAEEQLLRNHPSLQTFVGKSSVEIEGMIDAAFPDADQNAIVRATVFGCIVAGGLHGKV